jgi:hypothetical protein
MSVRNLSKEEILSANQGLMYPVLCQPVLPGDNVRHKIDAIIRSQALATPLFSKMTVKYHSFYVAFRDVWDEWDDFIFGGEDGLQTPEHPYMQFTTAGRGQVSNGDLADHLMNLETGVDLMNVSALPIRAYQQIYNEYYRDQDITDAAVVSKASGNDTTTDIEMKRACWDKDYFTTLRPDTQKGDDVEITLTGNAPVKVDGATLASGNRQVNTNGNSDNALEIHGTTQDIVADMSDVSAIGLNDLRLAAALQRYKENILRSGARPVERLKAAFGVQPEDNRLGRPEYLGGGKAVIQFSEVIQSAPSIDDTSSESVGQLKGHGMGIARGHKYKKYIKDYGLIITIMTIRPKTSYAQGVSRHWTSFTKEEYFQPELQHIGMQQVKVGELYAGAADPDALLGHQNRYDEHRHNFDTYSGEMRGTLDDWHGGRIFPSEPALNDDLVECEGVDRAFATGADEFVCRIFHNIKVKNRTVSSTGKPYVF